jgi:hypothetical protein
MNFQKAGNHGGHGEHSEKARARIGLMNDRSDKAAERLEVFFAVPAVFAVVNWG